MPKLWQGDVAYYKMQTFKESQEWHLTNDLLLFLVHSLGLCPTLCDLMDCSMPGFPVPHHLPESAQTHVHWIVMPSNHLILCCPLLLFSSIFPSIRVFSSELVLHIRWPEFWSFSFSISPASEYSGLISFRTDWWSPCCPRDSQESSPTPQCKSNNSSVLYFLYSPTLTSIHDCWKNHRFD